MNYHIASFKAAYGTSSQLPESTSPEVSFAGRSNVGKSSLLNKLMYRKGLAKVSQTPGKTATISTTVYQLWRTNDEKGAMFWVLINLAISTVVLLSVNMLEARQKKAVKA